MDTKNDIKHFFACYIHISLFNETNKCDVLTKEDSNSF